VVLPAPQGKGKEALAWAETQLGKDYDRWDAVAIILEHLFRHLRLHYRASERYGCGEFVALAFQHTGVTLFPGREPKEIVPADFARFLPPDAIPRQLGGWIRPS
jgi:hypothetical protein